MALHIQQEGDDLALVVQVPVNKETASAKRINRVKVISADEGTTVFTRQPDRTDDMERVDLLELEVEMLAVRLEKLECPVNNQGLAYDQESYDALKRSKELRQDMSNALTGKPPFHRTVSDALKAQTDMDKLISQQIYTTPSLMTQALQKNGRAMVKIIPPEPRPTVFAALTDRMRKLWMKS